MQNLDFIMGPYILVRRLGLSTHIKNFLIIVNQLNIALITLDDTKENNFLSMVHPEFSLNLLPCFQDPGVLHGLISKS